VIFDLVALHDSPTLDNCLAVIFRGTHGNQTVVGSSDNLPHTNDAVPSPNEFRWSMSYEADSTLLPGSPPIVATASTAIVSASATATATETEAGTAPVPAPAPAPDSGSRSDSNSMTTRRSAAKAPLVVGVAVKDDLLRCCRTHPGLTALSQLPRVLDLRMPWRAFRESEVCRFSPKSSMGSWCCT
jgi:hypothetical protein